MKRTLSSRVLRFFRRRFDCFRDGVSTLFLRRNSIWGLEFLLGCSAILNAIQVYTFDDTGESLAPFLDSAFTVLALPRPAWVAILLFMGMAKIAAMCYGVKHNNAFLIRSKVAFVASLIWSMVGLAILANNQPAVTSLRYMLAWFGSIIVFFTLQFSHRERLERENSESRCVSSVKSKWVQGG